MNEEFWEFLEKIKAKMEKMREGGDGDLRGLIAMVEDEMKY